ncbi:MAG: hypothetical protein WA419_20570 [Silvibacterium sp.]
MQLNPKNSRKWNIFALSILALAIAVFAWGLKSKLSLYDSVPPSSHHVVLAKLLSNRERPADTVTQIEHATAPSLIAVCVAFTLSAGLFLDPRRQSRWILQRAQNPQRRPIPVETPQRSLRPPPSRR